MPVIVIGAGGHGRVVADASHQLVATARRLPEFPDREVEWRSFLAQLRERAVDDLLPESFDARIVEVFGPIIPP